MAELPAAAEPAEDAELLRPKQATARAFAMQVVGAVAAGVVGFASVTATPEPQTYTSTMSPIGQIVDVSFSGGTYEIASGWWEAPAADFESAAWEPGVNV